VHTVDNKYWDNSIVSVYHTSQSVKMNWLPYRIAKGTKNKRNAKGTESRDVATVCIHDKNTLTHNMKDTTKKTS